MKRFFAKITFIIVGFLITNPIYSANFTISVLGISFIPSELTINPGDQINFVFSGHTATSSSVPIGANAFDFSSSSSYSTTVPGVYNYYCRPHERSGMVASFTVSGATLSTTGSFFQTKENKSDFYIYPNPVKSELNISFPENIDDNIYTTVISNSKGEIILKTNNKSTICKNNKGSKCTCLSNLNQIDIKTLIPDIYYINILQKKKNVFTTKFIKE